MPVVLWTDALIFLLLTGVVAFALFARRREHLRAPWRRVGRSGIAMASLVVLGVYLAIGLMDSMHYRPSLPSSSQTQSKSYSTEVLSVFDWLAAHLRDMEEKTYSAPFASHLFVKETVETPDGGTRRIYPRLVYGGRHLDDPRRDRLSDILATSVRAAMVGVALWLALSAAFIALWARRHGRRFGAAGLEILRGATATRWRPMLVTVGVCVIVICVALALSFGYHVLGTDKVGEDVLYQTLKSIRTGLVIGTLTTLVMLPFAVGLGITAGYFRGLVDDLIQYLYTTLNSIPSVLLIAAAILILQVYMDSHAEDFASVVERADRRLLFLCLILGFTSWTGLCRYLRAESWKLREVDYVQAATALGATHFAILGSQEQPVRAVDGVSFDIQAGKTFALLGESGCGKSMTALSLLRLLPSGGRIVGGQVLFQGRDLLRLPEAAMRQVRGGGIAMIFQEPMTSLNPVMSVGDQIAEALVRHTESPGVGVRQRVEELLEAVRIPDAGQRLHEYPHQLSGGMKQRVMIAIALAGDPALLIADEPTTALDVTIQAQVLDLLRTLQQERNMSLLLITHDLGVVAETADRVAVMYAGQIVEQATREAFFAAPRHPYSRKLFDSLPSMEKRHQNLHVIRGTVPSLEAQFSGCRFAPRCEVALEVCYEQRPAWYESRGSRVLCHLYADPEQRNGADAVDRQSVASDTRQPSGVSKQAGGALLETRDLAIHFPIQKGLFRRTVGTVRAVDGVELSIPRGRTLALVGESGCGKTTAGKGILQLLPVTGGQVLFEGQELTTLRRAQMRRRRSEMQIIFQDPVSSMNPRMLVGDIISEGLMARAAGGGRQEHAHRVAALLEQVGMPAESAHRYPHEFSGGQRQRICIARALAVRPKFIVCDEPTSALDVSVQAQILNLLKRLQGELQLSYLFITHDVSVVSYIADEVAVMYLGRIVEHGDVETVLRRPAHPYTEALMSAVPRLEDDRGKGAGRKVIHVGGDLPSPAKPPAGCHFHPRCPRALPVCLESYPARRELENGHSIRCHLYE